MDAWYLLQTKPRRERTAVENLERQGYRTYLPLLRVRRRVGGQLRERVEPMFPRYLFVRLSDQEDDWGPIRSTIGVAGLVRFGTQTARVPGALVEEFRARGDEEGVQVPPPTRLAPGDRVRIVEGALAGLDAVYQARSGKERVVVLLEVVERLVPVHLKADTVEPL